MYERKTEQYLNPRQLTRQHSALTDSYVEIKLQFQAALNQVFPEYEGVFSDLCGKLSLNTLLHYPTSADIQKVNEETLANDMSQFEAKCSSAWFRQLKQKANRNPFQHLSVKIKSSAYRCLFRCFFSTRNIYPAKKREMPWLGLLTTMK